MNQTAKCAYEKISQVMQAAYKAADRTWLMEHTKALTALEAPQTFPAYEKSARYIHKLLQDNGFDAEYLEFPADGKTVYQDKCMPIAWDATVGRLTVKSSPLSFSDPVIADIDRLPIHLVKHSVATPEGGIVARVVTESQMLAGENCAGAMVLLEAESRPGTGNIGMLLDLGALGFISEYLVNPMDKPDDVYWANAATDGSGWHATLETRDFIGFSISPRTGRRLRQAAQQGGVSVLVECDGRRYPGTLPAVTALIPGKQKREVWLMAHTFEPFSVDDSVGVIGCIGMVKTLQKLIAEGVLPPLEFSIRLVFAMEVYGFAAVADHLGGCLRDKVLGALNADMIFGGKFNVIQLFYAPLAVPFYGNFIIKMVSQVFTEEFKFPKVVEKYLSHHDDMFLSDSSVGLPTIWPLGEHVGETGNVDFHHNSSWDNDYLDEENFARAMGYYTAWVGLVAGMNEDLVPAFAAASAELAKDSLQMLAAKKTCIGETADRMAFLTDRMKAALANYKLAADHPAIDAAIAELTAPESASPSAPAFAWLEYADKLIPTRVGVGLPFDRTRIPKKYRKGLPGSMIYGQLAFVFSAMDGKKTLKQALCEAFWERPSEVTDKTVKQFVDSVMYLASWGYLEVENRAPITKAMIVDALKRVGVRQGDVLLMHSGLSHLGHIDGGADTVLDALAEAVGEEGTVLMPAFTRPYIAFEGSVNKSRIYRPFAPEFFDNINTGAIPKAQLYRPGNKRSAHATHSWCGFGKMADYCLSAHTCLEPPASENSPMAKALELGGKVLFFGSDIHTNTFLHYLEDKANAPFLENAVVKIKDAAGRYRTEVIHNHLPGHRSFYGLDCREGKFYRNAFAKGLQVQEAQLGMGRLHLMDLKQLDTIGMELLREDPLATLCDSPTCSFCRKFRK